MITWSLIIDEVLEKYFASKSKLSKDKHRNFFNELMESAYTKYGERLGFGSKDLKAFKSAFMKIKNECNKRRRETQKKFELSIQNELTPVVKKVVSPVIQYELLLPGYNC